MINRVRLILILLVLISLSCKKSPVFESVEIMLNDNWSFRKLGDVNFMPAQVPGDIFSDLLKNEKIDDPFYRDNEKKLQWVAKEDWEYQTEFDVPLDILKNDQVLIHFEGLDTYADVYLNEKIILRADNMFRYWDIPCKSLLKERGNTLSIFFHSAIKVGMQKLKQLPYLLPALGEQAPNNEKTNVFTRKAAFQYGWEWAPRMVTCGIWRPVSLRAWSLAHISEILLDPQKISKDVADYNAVLNIDGAKAGIYDLNFFIDDHPIGNPFKVNLRKGANKEVFNFQIEKPNLWWCNGMGDHYLYTLQVQLSQGDKLITGITQKFGVRKLELVQDSDAFGRSFYFKLNGLPVFMKGANYIPSDVFLSRINGQRYEQLVRGAVDANMNMIRVWGGGMYENDSLYLLCDKNGILVWHDFMFASAMQPDDSAHLENIRLEAIQNVKRLRNHPCIALWCGNNQNLEAWHKWNWNNLYPKEVASKIWNGYETLFHHILPDVVSQFDPKTPYWASSPSAFGNRTPDKRSGDEHEWHIWSEMAPFSTYGDRPGRFVSEYGMQSFPSLKTLHTFANDSDFEVHSPLMDFRQRSSMPWINPTMNGNQMISNYIQMYYNDPSDFESFVYLSQVMQADALKAAIEAHRVNRPRCMGSLYWQLNDCWPTVSCSTIDYFGRWKPAHYTIRRAFANFSVIPGLSNGKLNVFAVSDSTASVKVEMRLTVVNFAGKIIWGLSDSLTLGPDTVQLLWKGQEIKVCPPMLNSKVYMLTQLLRHGKIISENILYFTDSKYLDLPIPDISYKVKGTADQYEIVMVSDKFAKNVVLETFEKDAHFSDNNFDLLPRREIMLTVTYPGTREELLNDLKLYSLVDSY